MELDVAAPAIARRAWSIRAQIMGKALVGRVIDGNAELLEPDVERVINTWFSPVSGVNGKVDITVQVRPSRATNPTGTGPLRVFVRRGLRVDLHVRRDAGPVHVQACAVVVVFQMAPVICFLTRQPGSVLAPATDAEVRLESVVHDPPAAGHEVADPGAGNISGE